MTIFEITARLQKNSACRLCPPADPLMVSEIENFRPKLPASHREFLKLANGASTYFGHLKVFGIGCERCIDLAHWNRPETWKFAWRRENLDGWLCFAETSWGEQYAYSVDELSASPEPEVYHLGVAVMDAAPWEKSFSKFLESTVLLQTEHPYMVDLVPTYKAHGELGWDETLAFSPSLLFDKDEDVQRMIRMKPESQLIADGDIHSQIKDLRPGDSVQSVEPYLDEMGRSRMRLRLSKARP